VSGYSVAADKGALAGVMQIMIDDPELAEQMGKNALEKVQHISWKATLDKLLMSSVASGKTCDSSAGNLVSKRLRIVVAVNFSVWPPQGGGQSRVYNVYRSIAQVADVTIVSLGGVESEYRVLELESGLIEISVPKSAVQQSVDQSLECELDASVSDISTINSIYESPDYLQALLQETRGADLVIASHPYLYNAIRTVYRGSVWYEAHNVELDMKSAVLSACMDKAGVYIESVRQTEQALCKDADRVLVCSEEDAARLNELYGCDDFSLVPNGVSTTKERFINPEKRLQNKRRLGLESRLLLLFMGSWHGPNIDAVGYIKEMAAKLPQCDFFIMGSVCEHPVCENLPANVYRLGVLDEAEKTVWMSAVDIALNPIVSGSGTNLKMLDYASAGIPVITTKFGNRGLGFRDGHDVFIASIDAFASLVGKLEKDRARLTRVVGPAYERTQNYFDWSVVTEEMKKRICLL
jgi:glycosyltransferase involved in cell wall biosynthesis